MKAKQIPGIPPQKKGSFHDTESEKFFDTPDEAFDFFEVLKIRLFNVNQWKHYCGEQSADFALFDSYGKAISRKPEIGDFIRINIPGPGNTEGKGYDWVKIVGIAHENENDYEKVLIICSPSVKPGDMKNNHIAHFYSSQATSNFMILREKNYIKTGIYGRNETPNFNASFINKIRNIMIALGGMLGFSKIQWKCLTDGFLDF
ncbi:hypothetical protein [Chryseobacterium daeguense]|uniref:hypothetical protein n=1 Tax=Chryseobacterium daeguense TaxID=412438 RepID=UPI00040ED91A|nr:hypothetical protein [Chryseobacterium daeguense]